MTKKYYCLQPAKFRLDGGAMFGIIPKPLWNKKSPADDFNRIDLALRLLLIQKKDQLILIDTGIGDYHGDKFDENFDVRGPKSPIDNALFDLGFNCSDITDLIISHLHFDHAGGITLGDNKPTFPNATLHLHRSHYEYSLNSSERDRGSFHTKLFNPIVDYYRDNNKLHFFEGEKGVIFDEFEFICSHGHTPYLAHMFDDRFIYMADIVPTSAHIHIPWVMGYDIHSALSVKDKKRIYEFIRDKNLTMFFEHDPLFWGGKIEYDEGKNKYFLKDKYEAPIKYAFQLI